jgi:SAM-dependent methyltransferase
MINVTPSFDEAGVEYQRIRLEHWNKVAQKRDHWRGMGRWYHRRINEIYQFLVNPNQRILEIGCGMGSLISQLRPSHGVGVDFSPEMIARARQRHPEIEYHQLDAHDLSVLEGTFDVIIFSDTFNDMWDVQCALEQVKKFCSPHTRLIINFYSHVWQLPLMLAQKLNLATKMLTQNWLTPEDVNNMLLLAGFESIRTSREILWPLPLGGFANRYLVKLWPFNSLALSNFVVARPSAVPVKSPSVSVVVAARNEAGNIKNIFGRLPKMGSRTELVFVEGHSRDNTFETIQKEIPLHPSTPSLVFQQTGIGKADAIRLGFEKASGDILMILDADLTVPPEDLPRFYEAIATGKGEFINGVRLIYPMEKQAMRTLNFIGNKLFSLAFSWMLGQPIKDTLCGTKVMWREDYEKIAANRSYFGDFDPFGDFDLIFGAAKLNRKIVDLPIRYRERTYGTTNISRWKHGLLLLRMVAFAARRIKFV